VDEVVYQCKGLNDSDIEQLQRVEASMAILADVNRSDVLLYCLLTPEKAVVVSHSRPHSVSPVYAEPLAGLWVGPAQQPLVFRVLQGRFGLRTQRSAVANGAPIMQKVLPVRNRQGRIIAALCIETNLIEHERQRRRSKVFQWAVRQLQQMAARGELADAASLTPFGEHDGIILVDRQYCIRYASGIATNLYRRIGIMEGLVGKRLSELGTHDAEIVAPVFDGSHCIQQETDEGGRTWIKRGVPVLAVTEGWRRWSVLEPLLVRHLARRVQASLILIRDTTESRLKEQEIKVKTALIREVHHRVKNNLQTIAALLRMQARRSQSEETRQALQEGINRILSVAVVHEFLAHEEANAVSLREVATKIVRQIRQGIVAPDQQIHITIEGDDVLLPAQQATSCALIINELLLNSIEHGFQGRAGGRIALSIGVQDSNVRLSVQDNGQGLPADFDLRTAGNLGLQIVRTLVQDDLKGTFSLENTQDGVIAVISFPKGISGGD
jgi:two-component sensor histidine kinase